MKDDYHPSEGGDHQRLLELVSKACQHPRGTQRNRYLNRLIRDIAKSGKLWKENTPYYADALQKTWEFLSKNLCEATTAKQPYDPTRSQITTWLNSYLKKRLLDYRLEEQAENQRQQSRELPLSFDDRDNNYELVETLEAKLDLTSYLEEFLEWIEKDPTGELKSKHLPKRPDVNCQILLQRRCWSGQSIEQIAADLGCKSSALYNLYKREGRPLLQKFAGDRGYQLTIPGA
jgi:hypothetical protein